MDCVIKNYTFLLLLIFSQIVENQFILSFSYRLPDQRGSMVQFAFCYPWAYDECQERLSALDETYKHCQDLNQKRSVSTASQLSL